MKVAELKAQIQSNTLKSLYIFTGDEWAVQDIYIKQISKVKQVPLKRIDNISSIKGTLGNKTFTSSYSVYVVRDDKEFIREEKLQELIEKKLSDNIIIFLWTKPDKRSKFYKKYANSIVEFEPLAPNILKKYIKQHIDLSDKSCEQLMEICEYDYGRCLLEIDKIKNYMKHLGPAPMQDGILEKFLKEGVIYRPPKDVIFELIDVILDADANKTFNMYENQKQLKDYSVLGFITLLYNNTRALLQVQSYRGNSLAAASGLSQWQINNAKKHLNKRTNEELIRILKLCQRAEQGIKKGILDEKYVVDCLLVSIF